MATCREHFIVKNVKQCILLLRNLYVCDKIVPVHGGWSVWGPWSECSASCGYGGTILRTRACDDPAPLHGGQTCLGSEEETEDCDTDLPLCMSNIHMFYEWKKPLLSSLKKLVCSDFKTTSLEIPRKCIF